MAYTTAQVKQSRAIARELTAHLSTGQRPSAIPLPIRLQPGEQYFAQGAPLYLTNRRFAPPGRMQWIDLWFADIRMSTCDGWGITLHVSKLPPTRLHVWPIDFYFAMFHYLAYNDVIQIPPDPS